MTIVSKGYEIFNGAVSVGGGKQYSSVIRNHPDKIISVTSEWDGTLVATFSLESRKIDGGIGWVPEPLAVFEKDPAGSPDKSVDSWPDAASTEYRIGIDPSAGSGNVVLEASQ